MKMKRQIYFIRAVGSNGPIKIGASKNIARRMIEVEQWCPFPLELLAVIDGDLTVERRIQLHFSDSHSHQEWFHPTEKLVRLIAKLQAGIPLCDAISLGDKPGILPRKRWHPTKREFTTAGVIDWMDAQEVRATEAAE